MELHPELRDPIIKKMVLRPTAYFSEIKAPPLPPNTPTTLYWRNLTIPTTLVR